MSGNFPYARDSSILPYAFTITGPNDPLQPVQINKQELADKRIETFRLINPARCWIWLRGWLNSSPMTAYSDIAEKGLIFPPGGVEVLRTQFPDFIAVVAADVVDVPPLDGSGAYQYAGRKCYIQYGGGL